jgi:hypothetical protein
MCTRAWTVGLLAELDPIDDRHAEKMEGEGKRLLGYNTNMGAQIHIRLRWARRAARAGSARTAVSRARCSDTACALDVAGPRT